MEVAKTAVEASRAAATKGAERLVFWVIDLVEVMKVLGGFTRRRGWVGESVVGGWVGGWCFYVRNGYDMRIY